MEIGKTTNEGFFFLERWLLNIYQHNTARKNKSNGTSISLATGVLVWCYWFVVGGLPDKVEWEVLENALARNGR